MNYKFLGTIFASCFFVGIVSFASGRDGGDCQSCSVQDSIPELALDVDSTQHLSIIVAGDLMQHEAQIRMARRSDGSYDYSGYFEPVSDYINETDIAIANLEVTLGNKPYTGYPAFSAPDEYLYAIKDAGFDILFTANNHSCDRGKKGILRTIQMCDSVGVKHLGTYKNALAREEQYPFIIEKNGIKVALLNFTYGTNGIRVPEPTIVNRIDTSEIAVDIEKAKSFQPDLIIAFPHWGIERETKQRKSEEKLAKWMIEKGVDHVIGGHPHVIQPIEFHTDTVSQKQHLVAYSLGNFVSNMLTFPTYGGLMLRMEFEKTSRDKKTIVSKCDYILTFVSTPSWNYKKYFRVYPVDVPDSLLNNQERKKRDDYVKMARDLFGKYNIGISEYYRE